MTKDAPSLVIEAGHAERRYWSEIWHYRELLYFLAWRDISVRYKQTLLGVAWVVVRPLLTMLVFTVVFGKLAGLPSEAAPYAVMVLAAMLPWQLFAGNMADSGNSIVNNSAMISKVYFPRLIVPLSTVLIHLVDFAIAALLLAVLMAWHGIAPGWRIVTLPCFIMVALATSTGIGLWIAALNVKYRDFRFLVAFALQLGLYISPVGFSSKIVPETWRLAYSLNPMVGIIDGFRWALLGGSVYWPGVAISACMAAALLITGVLYFRKSEKSFADDI